MVPGALTLEKSSCHRNSFRNTDFAVNRLRKFGGTIIHICDYNQNLNREEGNVKQQGESRERPHCSGNITWKNFPKTSLKSSAAVG